MDLHDDIGTQLSQISQISSHPLMKARDEEGRKSSLRSSWSTINLPDRSGISCIRELREKCRSTEVIMLTAYEEEDKLFDALREGASGYLLKTSTPAELFEAIADVYSGGAPFSSHIARKVASQLNITLETVRTYVKRICAKLHVHSKV